MILTALKSGNQSVLNVVSSIANMRNFILSIALFLLPLPSARALFVDDLHYIPVFLQVHATNAPNVAVGTGFFTIYSNEVFFVTAAHCLFDMTSTNKSQLIGQDAIFSLVPKGVTNNVKCFYSLNLQRISSNGQIKRHPTHDVAVIRLGFTKSITNSNHHLTYYLDGVSPSPCGGDILIVEERDMFKEFNDVSEGSDSYLMGYPLELISGKSGEIDYTSPLIRRGIISQKNRITHKLIIDSAVFGGNSGGPVLMAEQPSMTEILFRVVGIVTQYVPDVTTANTSLGVTNAALVNSGYCVAEPVDYVLELMREFPLPP